MYSPWHVSIRVPVLAAGISSLCASCYSVLSVETVTVSCSHTAAHGCVTVMLEMCWAGFADHSLTCALCPDHLHVLHETHSLSHWQLTCK